MNGWLLRNATWVGLVVGMVVPFVAFGLLLTIYDQMEAWGMVDVSGIIANFRQRTCAILAICTNMISANIYKNRRMDLAMKGVIYATFFYVIIWVIMFGIDIIQIEQELI